MATELIRTWELLADGKRRDTGVDERWDGTSGSYDVARPAAYKPSKDHAYWFGHGRGSTEAVTVPADEDEDRRPRRFFVAVATGRREPVYPPTPKKGPMATPHVGDGRPYADGPSDDRDWMNPLKANRPGTTVRTMSDSISVGANAEMPAATGHSPDRVAAEQPARSTSDRGRAAKPEKASKVEKASKPEKAAKPAKASTARPEKAKKAKPAAKALKPARKKATKAKPRPVAKAKTAKKTKASKPAKRRTPSRSVRAKARPASKAQAKASRGRAAKPASRKKAAARSRRPTRR